MLISIVSFLDRIEEYSDKILGKKLTKIQIDELRNDFGFDTDSEKFTRNTELPFFVITNRPDECECCKGKYRIEDRSFPWYRFKNKYYFEVHHFISLSNHQSLDISENLVKLCPTCHKALKKHVGTEQIQKEYIKNILKNNSEVLEFSKTVLDTNDIDELVEKVYLSLK